MRNKQIYLSFLGIIFLLNACVTVGNLGKTGIQLEEGTELHYEVRAQGKEYPFNVIVNNFSKTSITFDWNMGDNRSGHIAMTENALINAYAMHNYFGAGYKLLTEKTSVWVSQEVFQEAKKGNAVSIDYGRGNEEFTLTGKEIYSFDGKQGPKNLPIFVLKSTDKSKEIWVLDDPNNRLIVKMVLDFNIDLIKIKPI